MDRVPVTAAPWPWLRALVAGAVGLTVTLAAHTSVDGALPSVPALAGSVLVLTLLARLATAAEVRLPVLLAGLTAAQLGLHAAFLYLATGRATHPGTAGWLCCGDATPIREGTGAAGLSRGALVLLAAHLLAVAVTAFWLRRLELRVWRAARAAAGALTTTVTSLVHALVALARAVTPHERPQVAPTPPVLPLPGSVLLTRRVRRRGPPVAVAR
ncbi:MAG TPA: hypothetical protein VHE83_08730 [Mycobacteriales bacterium]|nr:hypothetical protein [Mycobacteriales bacterium]